MSVNRIRRMQISDVTQMADIVRSSMPFPWREQAFYDCFQQHYSGWVMFDENQKNQMVGFAIILYQLDECHLINICMRQDYQRQGLASELLNTVMVDAEKHAVRCITLEVRASNHAAIAFYQRFHFIQKGCRKDYYLSEKGREDALIFTLELSGDGE